jgi:GxxExxY protein
VVNIWNDASLRLKLNFMPLPESLKRDPFVGHLLGAIAEVYSKLGPGLLVDAYREALTLEISSKGIPFQVKPRIQAFYAARPIDGYFFIPDLTIANRFIVEVRTGDSRRAGEIHRYMRTYLTLSQFKQGFILDFDAPSLISVAEYMAREPETLLR